MDDNNMFLINELHEEEMEEENEISFEVLHPDNPVMIQFQNALSEMLERKLKALDLELFQMEGEIKKIKQEKKQESELICIQKSELEKLEAKLYECNESIASMLDEKEILIPEMERLREMHDKELTVFREEEKLSAELLRTIEVQNHFLHQISEYETKESSNLFIMQREMKKNESDKIAYLKRKAEQDYALMQIENDILTLELQMQDYKRQIEQNSIDIAEIEEQIKDEEKELEENTEDNARLQYVWRHTIFLIGKRDEEYANAKADLERREIEHKEKLVELKSYEKSIEDEMLRNGTLIAEKKKQEMLLNKLRREHRDLVEANELAEHKCNETDKMIELTEKTLEDTIKASTECDRILLQMENKLRNLEFQKCKLEADLMSQLQDEIISNSTTAKLNDEICKIRDDALREELTIKDLNDKYYQSLAVLDRRKQAMDRKNECLKKLNDIISAKKTEILNYQKDLEYLDSKIAKQNRRLADERRKLAALQERLSGRSEIEEKICRIQEELDNVNKSIEDEKIVWTQMQNDIASLTKSRTDLFEELSSAQRHLSILEEQNQKLDQDIAKTEEEGAKYEKSISHLKKQISKLNSQLYDEKREGERLDSENCTIQGKIMEKLQIAEQETSTLIKEIDDLQDKKTSLEKELLNLQREELEWEKKVKMATEMKKRIVEEQSEAGEIGSMKNEIHRMEVRYAQLKKAQGSLMSNLETCVTKRERLLDRAMMKEKKEDIDKRNKKKLARHIDFLRTKIAKRKSKLLDLENEYNDMCHQKDEILTEISKYERRIESLEHSNKEMNERIEENELLKHKNLENLISKQRFAEFLSNVRHGKIRFSSNELALEKEYIKQQSLQNDLIDVLENLLKEFPEYRNEIARILNVLYSYTGFELKSV